MNRGQFSIQLILPVVLLMIILIGGIWSFSQDKSNKKEIDQLQKNIEKQKQKETDTQNTVTELSDQLETLFVEKNGTANYTLVRATADLFSTVFNYETDREEDSVSQRKKRAEKLASEKAVNALFPHDSSKTTASVSTVSKMVNDPEVFLKPSDDKELTALVFVSFAVSIAGSEEQNGTFMYKVTFDSMTNLFTRIQLLGEVTIP